VTARVELVEFPDAPLDLELSARDVGRPLAQRPLQVVDLDESLNLLALSRLCEVPCQAQHLVAIGVLLRLLPGCLPATCFPRVPPTLHLLERSGLHGSFVPSEQGKPTSP
jgi:hypothetical protein